MNNKATYHQLKRHLEDYASRQLAKKLLCQLPIPQEFDLRPLIGNGQNSGNLEAIQTWIKAVMADHPTCCFELTFDHWHARLVVDLLNILNTGEDA